MQRALLSILAFGWFETTAEINTNWISFSTNSVRVNEISGVVTFPVVRSGDVTSDSTVEYSFAGASAGAGADFLATAGTLAFGPNETSKTIAVEIVDDAAVEAIETFAIRLSNATGSHSLTNENIEITIIDNDAKWVGIAASSTFDMSETVAVNALLVRPDHRIWFGGVPTQFSGKFGLIETDGSISEMDQMGGFLGSEVMSLALDYRESLIFGQVGPAAGRFAPSLDSPYGWNVPAEGETRDLFALPDGTVVLAGKFAIAGEADTYGLVRLTRHGMLEPGFDLAGAKNYALQTAIADGSGGMIAAYSFTNGVEVIRGVGRWEADGTRDTLFGSPITDLLGTSSEITVMENEPGQSRAYVAVRSGDEGDYRTEVFVMDWQGEVDITEPVDSFRGTVNAIAFVQMPSQSVPVYKRVYGGDFTEMNGEPVNNVSGMPPEEGPNGPIRAIAVEAAGSILIGGHFTEFSGHRVNGLVRIHGETADSEASRVYWNDNDFRGFERMGDVEISLSRSGSLTDELTVNLVAAPRGSASLDDLGTLPLTITFAAGEDDKIISASILNDSLREGSEAYDLVLTAQEGGSAIVTQGSALLTILDDETPGTPDGAYVSPPNTPIAAMARQRDGKILAGGVLGGKPHLARLYGDGSIDESFTNAIPSEGRLWTSIYEIEETPDGKIYVSGGFRDGSFYGVNSLARLNSDGSLDTTFNPRVRAGPTQFSIQPSVTFALQNDGRIVIANTDSSRDLVHQQGSLLGRWPIRLNSDGTLDTSFSSAYQDGFPQNPRALDIEIDGDGRVFLAGRLQAPFASTSLAFSCLSASGAIETDYPLAISGEGYALLRDGDNLYLAGEFLSVNGGPVRHLLRIDLTNDSVDESFQVPTDGGVRDILLLDSGQLLITGPFTKVHGIDRHHIAVINADGSLDETVTFGMGLNYPPQSIAQQPDGKILVGGFFTTADKASFPYFVRFESEKSAGVISFATNRIVVSELESSVTISLTRKGGSEGAITGTLSTVPQSAVPGKQFESTTSEFSFADGQSGSVQFAVPLIRDSEFTGDRTFAIRFEAPGLAGDVTVLVIDAEGGGLDPNFLPQIGGTGVQINDIAMSPTGQILAVGRFTSVQGNLLTNMAFFSSDLVLLPDFAPSVVPNQPIVSGEFQADGRILVAGTFTKIGQSNAVSLARINTDLTYDWEFIDAYLARPFAAARAFELSDNRIIGYGSQLFRLNSGGVWDRTFMSGSGLVNTVIPWSESRLLAGQRSANGIRLINANGTVDPAFAVRTEIDLSAANVYSIVPQGDDRILVGGDFNKVNTVASAPLVRLNLDGTVDPAFNAVSIGTNSISTSDREAVYSILPLLSGDILIGGNFNKVAGQTRTHIALLGPDGELKEGFAPELLGHSVREMLLLADGGVLVRGAITNVNGVPVQGLFKLRLSENQAPVFQITSPSQGTTIAMGEPVVVTANAFDPDGFLANVRIVINGETNEFTGPPYTLSLLDLPAGDYTVTGIATDLMGLASQVFGPITFHVNEAVAPPIELNIGFAGSELTFSFNGFGRTYKLYATEDFLVWDLVQTFSSLSGEGTAVLEPTGSRRFFKVVRED